MIAAENYPFVHIGGFTAFRRQLLPSPRIDSPWLLDYPIFSYLLPVRFGSPA